MGCTVALLPDRQTRARLRQAAKQASRGVHAIPLHFPSDWAELHLAVRETNPVLAFLDPHPSATGAQTRLIRGFVALFPQVTPIVYGTFDKYPPGEMIQLASAGVREAVPDRNGEEVTVLMQLLRDPPAPQLVDAVLAGLPAGTPSEVVQAVECVIRRAPEWLTPASLARACMCDISTLNRRLRVAGFPSPNRLIVWGRLWIVVRLLERRILSVAEIAARLGYGSDAVEYLLQRFRSRCASEVETPGVRADENCTAAFGFAPQRSVPT